MHKVGDKIISKNLPNGFEIDHVYTINKIISSSKVFRNCNILYYHIMDDRYI